MKQEQTQIQTILITEWTKELKGRGTLGSSTFDFPYVGPGDRVHFEKRGRGKRTWFQIHEIQSSNEGEKFAPKCSYFSQCGGCRAQHIPYKNQFQLKVGGFFDYYRVNWGLEPILVPALNIWEYRNRMDFAIFPDQIGLRQEGNFRKIIDIEVCAIQSSRANKELQSLRSLIQDSKLAYNRKTGSGFLKYLTLRTNSNHTELQSILTFTEGFQAHSEKKYWQEKFLEVTKADHLIFCYNREQAEVSAVGKPELLKGNLYYTETILDQNFHVPFDSFFQPNPIGFLPILKFIEQEISNCNEKSLVDLFCGSGFFSLLFGEKFHTIRGYDIVPNAIEKASQLLKEKFPEKEVSFFVKDLYALKDEFIQNSDFFQDSLLIIDPPRNGMGKELIKILNHSQVKKILYVSCNPHSQREDLEQLRDYYLPKSILFTDPYPHTPHLESVLVLERKNEF